MLQFIKVLATTFFCVAVLLWYQGSFSPATLELLQHTTAGLLIALLASSSAQ